MELLLQTMSESGMTKTTIAKRAGIERYILYNRIAGVGEFTASEIVGLTRALKLTKAKRDEIFFD